MKQRPLVYMWKAIYKDGSIFPQYDDKTFKTNIFKDINVDSLIRLDLIPFTKSIENDLKEKGTLVKSIPFLPKYSIEIKDDRRPIYYRDVYISQEEYHLCNECKQEFKYSKNMSSIEGKYPSPICPNCGSHDFFFCKKCDRKYNFEQTSNGLCPLCKGHLKYNKITSQQYSREKRWIEYIIGAQQTLNGINTQFRLRIDEYGNCNVE